MKTFICCLFFLFLVSSSLASDSTFVNVYFLYGSKPKKEYKDEESNWFGGKLGGHVGIGLDDGQILNFLPRGSLHIIGNNNVPHAGFYTHSKEAFWSILGYVKGGVKGAVLKIPISSHQKHLLDSISQAYLNQVPYDYAFLGMRCGASTYKILAQLGILKKWGPGKTWRRIFYPRRLRKRLYKLADHQNWSCELQEGSLKRDWEKD